MRFAGWWWPLFQELGADGLTLSAEVKSTAPEKGEECAHVIHRRNNNAVSNHGELQEGADIPTAHSFH